MSNQDAIETVGRHSVVPQIVTKTVLQPQNDHKSENNHFSKHARHFLRQRARTVYVSNSEKAHFIQVLVSFKV